MEGWPLPGHGLTKALLKSLKRTLVTQVKYFKFLFETLLMLTLWSKGKDTEGQGAVTC